MNLGVWSSGMILALGDDREYPVEKLACERPWVQFPARPFFQTFGETYRTLSMTLRFCLDVSYGDF